MPGKTYRINMATGETSSTPYEDDRPALHARIAELEHDVKVWKWNSAHHEQKSIDITRNMRRQHAERQMRLKRVWALISHKRKTVRMEDLREALQGYFEEADAA